MDERIRVGLVADPAAPTDIARGMADLRPLDGSGSWDITIVSEPFTTGSEDVDIAVDRLHDHTRQQNWDIVVGLTELPLHDRDGRHLLVESDPERRAAVLANRPWLLVPGLKSALVAALATGAVATINSTVWLLVASLPWWRLAVATIGSVALVVAWLVIDGELWDRPDDASPRARERSRLYNTSTLMTLLARSATGICSSWRGSSRRPRPSAVGSVPASKPTRRYVRPRTPSASRTAATASRASGNPSHLPGDVRRALGPVSRRHPSEQRARISERAAGSPRRGRCRAREGRAHRGR